MKRSHRARQAPVRGSHLQRAASDGVPVERLEPRALLAISTMVSVPPALQDYIVVMADQGDDMYVQRQANGSYLVANNSSFINDLGTPQSGYATAASLQGTSVSTVLYGSGSSTNQAAVVVPSLTITLTAESSTGAPNSWTLTGQPNGTIDISSSPSNGDGPKPLSATLTFVPGNTSTTSGTNTLVVQFETLPTNPSFSNAKFSQGTPKQTLTLIDPGSAWYFTNGTAAHATVQPMILASSTFSLSPPGGAQVAVDTLGGTLTATKGKVLYKWTLSSVSTSSTTGTVTAMADSSNPSDSTQWTIPPSGTISSVVDPTDPTKFKTTVTIKWGTFTPDTAWMAPTYDYITERTPSPASPTPTLSNTNKDASFQFTLPSGGTKVVWSKFAADVTAQAANGSWSTTYALEGQPDGSVKKTLGTSVGLPPSLTSVDVSASDNKTIKLKFSAALSSGTSDTALSGITLWYQRTYSNPTVVPNSPQAPTFQLPNVGDDGGVIAGTFAGVLTMTGYGVIRFYAPPGQNPYFAEGSLPLVLDTTDWKGPEIVGKPSISTTTGQVFFAFKADADKPVTSPSISASWGYYNDNDDGIGGYTYGPSRLVFPVGQTIPERIRADLLVPKSTISVRSAIAVSATTDWNWWGSGIDLRATNIDVGASLSAGPNNTLIGPSLHGSWLTNSLKYNQAQAETISINAPVSASSYDISVKDDPATPSTPQGSLVISPTGSLVATDALAGYVNITAFDSNVYVEGQINALTQTYNLQSLQTANTLSFSSVSKTTGINSGLIKGGTVAVTYGTPAGSPTNPNVFDVQTDIDKLRITAASTNSASEAFPLRINVREANALQLDAGINSSAPITIDAAGQLTTLASLNTSADVTLRSGGAFASNSPISTVNGAITLVADSLTIASTVTAGTLYVISDVDLASTGNVTIGNNAWTNATTIDGVIVTAGMRILLKDQTDAAQNGVYLAATGGSLVRAQDADTAAELPTGSFVRVLDGSNNKGTGWSLVTPGPISLGATNLLFTQSQKQSVKVATTTNIPMSASVTSAVASSIANRISAARVATTASLTATYANGVLTNSGAQAALTIDGVALQTNDRVLVKDQGNKVHNGIYVVTNVGGNATNWVLTRANDAANATALLSGFGLSISAGTSNLRTAWALQANATVNIDSLTFSAQNQDTVKVATTAPLTATYNNGVLTNSGVQSALTIDGVALQTNDRVLVKDQANKVLNGIYIVTTVGNASTNWVLTRAFDMPATSPVTAGFGTTATAGVVNTGTTWLLMVNGTIDVSSLTFTAPQPARLATTEFLNATAANGNTLTNAGNNETLVIDGFAVVAGDRILVKNQLNPAENGIYVVLNAGDPNNSWSLTRAVDAPSDVALPAGSGTSVTSGLANGGTSWVLSQKGTAGYDPLTFIASPKLRPSGSQLVLQVDGIPLAQNDRLLVKNQSDARQNGIYKVTQVSDVTQQTADVRLTTADALPTCIYANNSPGTTASTLTATVFGALTIDGINVAVGDRVLVKNQATAAQNGIYTVTRAGSASQTWRLTRAADADQNVEIINGLGTYTTEGVVNGGRAFVISGLNGSATIGTTGISFTRATPWEIERAADADTAEEMPYGFYVVSQNGSVNAAKGWAFGSLGEISLGATQLNFYSATGPLTPANGDVVLEARTGALTINAAVQAAGDTITLKAAGNISGPSRLVAARAVIDGGGSVDVGLSVAQVLAKANGAITLANTGAIDLVDVQTRTAGAITVSASGPIVATNVVATGSAAVPGTIVLTSTSSNLTARNVISSLGNVSLVADSGTVTVDGRVQALGNGTTIDGNVLLSTANGGIVLTAVADLSATKQLKVFAPKGTAAVDPSAQVAAAALSWTGQGTLPAGLGAYGTLEINRTDAGDIIVNRGTSTLFLAGASTLDGSISITASGITVTGDLTAGDKNSSLDHDITLTATIGDLLIDKAVTAPRDMLLNATNGRITGSASASTATGLLTAGNKAQIRAATQAVALTKIKSLDAVVTGPNATVKVVEADALIVTQAKLTGGGTCTIDITTGSATTPGGLTINNALDAGAGGTVTITAFGDITNSGDDNTADLTAKIAVLTSKTGKISLETNVDILDASAPQAGRTVTITDLGLDGLELRKITDSQANITVTASGTITVTDVKTTVGDVTLTAQGNASDVVLKSLAAAGTAMVTAGRSITRAASDLGISATTAKLTAQNGSISAKTAITSLVAQAAGDVTINNLAGIALGTAQDAVKSDTGSIVVTAAGPITATNVSALGGNVTLSTTVGDINVGSIKGLTSKQATATATVGAGGAITAVTITDGGAGYGTTPPQITIAPPGVGGTQATVDAVLTGGVVTDRQNLVGGSGYSATTPPQVTIAAPPIGKITLTAAGAITDIANTLAVDLTANQVVLTATGGQVRADLEVDQVKATASGAIALTNARGLIVDGLSSSTDAVSLKVNGSLTQTNTGAVVTGTGKVLTLVGNGTDAIVLTNANNGVGAIKAINRDANGNSANVSLTNAQALTLGKIESKNLLLSVAGPVSQTGTTITTPWGGVIDVETLDVTSTGNAAITLNTQDNKIATFRADAGTGNVSVKDVDAGLTLGAIKGGIVSVTSTGLGAITQAAVIEAAILQVAGNKAADITLDKANKVGTFAATNAGQTITFKAAGSLTLGAIQGTTINITAGGGIDQVGNAIATPWGGIIDATTLTLKGSGTAPISLGSQSNKIGTFSADNSSNMTRSDVAIRDVDGGLILGAVTGATVSIVSLGNGAITQSNGIKASGALNVTGNTQAVITLDKANEVSTFSATNGTQAITFLNKTGGLSLGTITGGGVTLTNNGGGISQAASTAIQATTLSVTGDGQNAITLGNTGNKVDTFQATNTKAGTAGANISFTDSDGTLTVNSTDGRDITISAAGTLTVAQAVTAGTVAGGDGDIYLKSTSGDIAVNANLTAKADRITLEAKQGTIAQAVGTTIDCQTLVWYAKSQPTFQGGNTNTIEGINLTQESLSLVYTDRDITIAGASAPNGVTITAKSVTIIDTITVLNAGNIRVTATGGAITFAQAGNVLNLTGGVTLEAATAIVGTHAGVDLTAQRATLTATMGTISLDLAVDTVSSATAAGPITLTNNKSLTASVITSSAGNVVLSTTSGNIAAGTVAASTGTVTLSAQGSITDTNSTSTNLTAKTAALNATTGTISLELAVDTVSSATAAGTVTLKNNRALTASGITSSAGNVVLSTTSGNIAVGTVSASTSSGTIALAAQGAIIDTNGATTNLTAKTATLTATTGTISLDLAVDTVSSATAAGTITLTNNKSLTASVITSSTGNVVLSTTSGNIAAGTVAASTGTVTLSAQGSITDTNGATTNVTAKTALLTATTGGIDLDLAVDSVSATAAGLIDLSDVNAVTLTNVTTSAGNIAVAAGGNIAVSKVVGGGNVTMITTGNVNVGPIDNSLLQSAKTLDLSQVAGTISITRGGRIVGNPTVLPSGKNIQIGGNANSASDLAAAITAANALPAIPGAVYEIVVSSGFTLTQPLTVSRPIALRGTSSAIVLSGSTTARSGLILTDTASGSRITNLAFSGFADDAIRLTNVQNALIRGVRVSNSTNGITVNGTSAGTVVQGNTLDRNTTGIRLNAATNVLIGGQNAGQGNVISNGIREGVFASGFCTGSQVIKNSFPGTKTPYNVQTSRNLRIIN